MKKKAKKPIPHVFRNGWKILHYYYCTGCGLIAINNDTTRLRIKNRDCDAADDDDD